MLLVGSNHFRDMWLDLVPQFTLGVEACTASGEAGTPSGPRPFDVPLARHVAQALVNAEFDVTISTELQIDHGQSHSIQYLLPTVPVVPLVVNVFVPPRPVLRRCVALGAALQRAISTFPATRRVVVVGSGGCRTVSRSPTGAIRTVPTRSSLVDAWKHGRTLWTEFEQRRRQIVRAFPAGINADFDRSFLAALEQGRALDYAGYDDATLEHEAGNGAHELRTWLIAAAATGGRGRALAYEPMPEWLNGMGVALAEVAS